MRTRLWFWVHATGGAKRQFHLAGVDTSCEPSKPASLADVKDEYDESVTRLLAAGRATADEVVANTQPNSRQNETCN